MRHERAAALAGQRASPGRLTANRSAFISATPGPETADASGDPMVITRYMYKPDAGEGFTHFNDNRRLHIFVVDVATKQVRQLTDGDPTSTRLIGRRMATRFFLFRSVRPNADQFFNYDVFAVKAERRFHSPHHRHGKRGVLPAVVARWKDDRVLATKRGLTDRETTMEDTHVWVMNADGSNRRELADD